MPRFKASILAACGLLVLAAVLGAIGPKRALAALGFTPVRDVDGPGRQPFSVARFVGPNSSNVLPGPPAGKRLVITYVSSDANGTANEGVIVRTNIGTGNESDVAAPYTHTASASWASVAGDSLAHAEPGTTLLLIVNGPNAADVSIHGYLVDVP